MRAAEVGGASAGVAAVELKGVSKSFGSISVIKGVDLTIEKGEFVVFVGASGSGKSTLLRMIAGLESVSAGDIRIGGRDVTFDEPAERGIAMVFQSYALYPHMNVYDNIAFNLRLAHVSREDGSPAFAGMDPSLDATVQFDGRLPRVRGDGPLRGSLRSCSLRAPPRSRGWTRARGGARRRA